ncbi:hypothetical protein [Butyrivibrio proteoclasticus]|uniref:hypothetical protein n=1 Tax=Butyrivibrio proteoclasticus TaxID=43305 RepID=UPI00047D9091|nr:hypothetical protein [Butyrivibrio proteoclasticus]
MKTSYKLYGTFWDNKDVSSKKLMINIPGEHASSESCLTLSEVLGNEQPIESVSFEGKSVVLLLDYMPANESVIVWNFYLKRLLQIVEYYKVETINCKDQRQASRLRNAIDNYIKKKTPNRLLAQSNGVL